jgi:hypothetical protein
MGIEYRNVDSLVEPPGYTHVAVVYGTHTVYAAGAVPIDAEGTSSVPAIPSPRPSR